MFVSLTESQREQTARELRANLALSGLDEESLERTTGWTAERVAATLDVRGAAPADVWRLRDVLERAVVAAGRTPVRFTVLTESSREAAREWYGIS